MRERAPMKTSWGDEYSISFYEVDAMLYQSRQKPFRNSPGFSSACLKEKARNSAAQEQDGKG
jgi:hypothetical protein